MSSPARTGRLGVPEPFDPHAIIRDYHRQYMFAATHPAVDIVAHPWWWMGAWKDDDGIYRTYPWFDDFGRIPESMHDEFAAATVQYGKAVEINAGALLVNATYPADFRPRYVEYLAGMKARGVPAFPSAPIPTRGTAPATPLAWVRPPPI